MSSVQAVREQLARDLPPGTARAAVIAYLDTNKIEHSGAADAAVINAIWRDVARNGPVSRSVRADFRFDGEGRLVTATVKDQFTGP